MSGIANGGVSYGFYGFLGFPELIHFTEEGNLYVGYKGDFTTHMYGESENPLNFRDDIGFSRLDIIVWGTKEIVRIADFFAEASQKEPQNTVVREFARRFEARKAAFLESLNAGKRTEPPPAIAAPAAVPEFSQAGAPAAFIIPLDKPAPIRTAKAAEETDPVPPVIPAEVATPPPPAAPIKEADPVRPDIAAQERSVAARAPATAQSPENQVVARAPESASPPPEQEMKKRETYITKTIKYSRETVFILAAWYLRDRMKWKAISDANSAMNSKTMRVGAEIFLPGALLVTREPMPEEFLDSFYPPKSPAKPKSPQPKAKPEKDKKPEIFGPK